MSGSSKTAQPQKMALTVDEAAHVLGVSRSTMFTLLREGRIRSVKLGPQIRRIPRAELDAYLAALLDEQSAPDTGAA